MTTSEAHPVSRQVTSGATDRMTVTRNLKEAAKHLEAVMVLLCARELDYSDDDDRMYFRVKRIQDVLEIMARD
jgi:hypothetical protein